MSRQVSLAELLAEAGLPSTAVVEVGPPTPDAPAPPEGPWVVVPFGSQVVVGGFSRGAFRAYAGFDGLDEARGAAVRLATSSPGTRSAGDRAQLQQRGLATAQAVREHALDRAGRPGPAERSPGDVLDLLGPETAHHLYALGTPFPERAQPPTELGGEYHCYEVLGALPEAQEGLAAPWFEQPGGGAMVVLGRPVRWYVDQGVLVELVDDDGA